MNDGFTRESLRQYAACQRGEFEKTLGEAVEIPTVSDRHQMQWARHTRAHA